MLLWLNDSLDNLQHTSLWLDFGPRSVPTTHITSEMRVLVAIFALVYTTAVDASGFSKICPLSSSPAVELEYDAAGLFKVVVDEDGTNLLVVGGRDLSGDKRTVQVGKQSINGNRYTMLRGTEQKRLQNTSTKYMARHCPCDATGNVYCLLDGIRSSVPDTCGIPAAENTFTISERPDDDSSPSESPTISCFELESQTVFVRNAWPVVVLWYGALFIFLLATENGKNARMFALNKLCPKLRINERYVNSIVVRESEIRDRLRAAAVRAANLADGPGRYLVRMRGMRVPGRLYRSSDPQEVTVEEEQEEATRRWIEQAEALGILNDREVAASSYGPRPQVEYVLKTRTFNAKKERARRASRRLKASVDGVESVGLCGVCNDDEQLPSTEENNNPTTPTKKSTSREPSTPETVASCDDRDDQSVSSEINESNDSTTENMQDIGSPLCQSNEEVSRVEEDDQEEDETFDCTICLTEVSDGDCVGVLKCSHIFHVDCLHQWIKRRNVCPLCQVVEIATPRPVEVALQSLETESSAVASGNTETENTDSNAAPWYLRPFFTTTSEISDNNASLHRTTSGSIMILPPPHRRMRDSNRYRQRRSDRRSDFW